MKSTLLLTGATGFLGGLLINDLSHLYDVITLSRSKNSDVTCDLSSSIPELHRSPDLIFHAAGKAHVVPTNSNQREEFYQVNTTGTENLIKAILKLPRLPKCIIFISSVAVYGLVEGEMVAEDVPLLGKTPYSQSKILAEEILTAFGISYSIPIGILRLPLVCGPNPPGNLGKMIRSFRRGLYPSIGDGSSRKSMIYGPDILQILPKISKIGGVYNLTDGYNPSFRELENCLTKVFNHKPILNLNAMMAKMLARFGDRVGNHFPFNSDTLNKIDHTLTFSDSKARSLLNWAPTPILDILPQIALVSND